MYRSALTLRGHTAPASLRLARVESLTFTGGSPYPAAYQGAYSELLELYGVTFDDEASGRAGRNSFTEMSEEMVRVLSPLDGPVDLIVLAHMTPDAEPGYPICFLDDVVPGETLGLAISDQGVVAPFTALRVASGYLRTGAARRALVIALDQSSIRRTGPLPEEIDPYQDSAVALVLDEAGALGAMSVHQITGIAPQDVRAAVDSHLSHLSRAAAPDAVVACVAGRGLSPEHDLPRMSSVVRAPGRLPCTGVWSAFATGLPEWSAAGGRVVVADYDRKMRYLSLCVVDVDGGGGTPKR